MGGTLPYVRPNTVISLLLLDVHHPLISELLPSSSVPLGIFLGPLPVAEGRSPNYSGCGDLFPSPHADRDVSAPPHLKKRKQKNTFLCNIYNTFTVSDTRYA